LNLKRRVSVANTYLSKRKYVANDPSFENKAKAVVDNSCLGVGEGENFAARGTEYLRLGPVADSCQLLQ
jgi:hypothetical protein